MFALIRAAFNQRRKTLANAVSNGFSTDGKSLTREQVCSALERMGLSAAVRGEALSLPQFAALTNHLFPEDPGRLPEGNIPSKSG